MLLLPGRISRCKRPLYRGGWSCVEKLGVWGVASIIRSVDPESAEPYIRTVA
jgi:hypothetical protein